MLRHHNPCMPVPTSTTTASDNPPATETSLRAGMRPFSQAYFEQLWMGPLCCLPEVTRWERWLSPTPQHLRWDLKPQNPNLYKPPRWRKHSHPDWERSEKRAQLLRCCSAGAPRGTLLSTVFSSVGWGCSRSMWQTEDYSDRETYRQLSCNLASVWLIFWDKHGMIKGQFYKKIISKLHFGKIPQIHHPNPGSIFSYFSLSSEHLVHTAYKNWVNTDFLDPPYFFWIHFKRDTNPPEMAERQQSTQDVGGSLGAYWTTPSKWVNLSGLFPPAWGGQENLLTGRAVWGCRKRMLETRHPACPGDHSASSPSPQACEDTASTHLERGALHSLHAKLHLLVLHHQVTDVLDWQVPE